jgi:hypothetical protein
MRPERGTVRVGRVWQTPAGPANALRLALWLQTDGQRHDLARTRRTAWRARSPGYAASALTFALFFYLRDEVSTHMVVDFAENPPLSTGFWTARLTAPAVWPRKA